jgi:hypothetical protein
MGYGRRRRRAARGSRSAAAGVRVASGEVGIEHARVHARVQWTRASRVDEMLLGGRPVNPSMEREAEMPQGRAGTGDESLVDEVEHDRMARPKAARAPTYRGVARRRSQARAEAGCAGDAWRAHRAYGHGSATVGCALAGEVLQSRGGAERTASGRSGGSPLRVMASRSRAPKRRARRLTRGGAAGRPLRAHTQVGKVPQRQQSRARMTLVGELRSRVGAAA